MFDRVISLIGEENFKKIKKTTVLIIGLGGVGGYAAESLVRSGVENLIIIDHDKIDLTNLNRQIITDSNNIGEDKILACYKRLKSINPNCQITNYKLFLDNTNISILNDFKIDYIIDACDTVATKKLLIDYAISNNIKLISSMGTANKIDPTKLEIIEIRKTSYDPLAKIIRKYMIKNYPKVKLMVVSSTEKPLKTNNLSSLIFVPATAGLLCSNYIIKSLIEN